ncbi:MAG: BatA domain-containing protein [Candidatus Marinimicrobia bacterium]|nr:BatA domain-containing protein [Candidatus Neomarinimicrobiota bacterium]MCF7904581.1 BatA domain-containing protein [Candidatus Neomarinimicrobiota bacterium]
MTFLNPLFLWFLPLVSIPVIIHLLAKRKSKRIAFPSLIFLKHLEQDALRKFNFRQLLLLIIRTLIVLLIILIFSRPTLNTGSGFGIRTQKTDLLVVVLDNTASFNHALDSSVGPWLGDLKDILGERGTRVLFCSSASLELMNEYQDIGPSFTSVYPDDLRARLSEQEDMDAYKSKTLVWIGDGQDIQEKTASLEDWTIHALITASGEDRGLVSLEIPRRSLIEDEAYQITAQIGFGSASSELALELNVNDKRINQTVVKSSNSIIELGGRVMEPGFQEGVLSLEQDAQQYNDLRYFVFEARGDIPVQIIRSERGPDFWRPVRDALESVDANLQVDILAYGQADELVTGRGGTIIVDDASLIPDYVWNQLKIFTENGGQLILFGNGGVKMQELLGLSTPLILEESELSFGLTPTAQVKEDLQALPITEVITENRMKVFKRFNVSSTELDRTWIRFLDDQPFLGVNYINSGRIVWFNTSFSLEGSNLALLGMFPSLVLDLAQYSGDRGKMDRFNAEIGDTIRFVPDPERGSDALFSVQRPDGTVDFQQPDSNFVIHYSQTDLPGIYRFLHGRTVLFPVAVNVSAKEASAHQKQYELERNIHVYHDELELSSAVLNQSSGYALWPLLLLLVLGLWMAEIYLSRIHSNWRSND